MTAPTDDLGALAEAVRRGGPLAPPGSRAWLLAVACPDHRAPIGAPCYAAPEGVCGHRIGLARRLANTPRIEQKGGRGHDRTNRRDRRDRATR